MSRSTRPEHRKGRTVLLLTPFEGTCYNSSGSKGPKS